MVVVSRPSNGAEEEAEEGTACLGWGVGVGGFPQTLQWLRIQGLHDPALSPLSTAVLLVSSLNSTRHSGG